MYNLEKYNFYYKKCGPSLPHKNETESFAFHGNLKSISASFKPA